MHRYFLFTLSSCFFLIATTSCPDDCESAVERTMIPVEVSAGGTTVTTGDTVWVDSRFPAAVEVGFSTREITEAGGLLSTVVTVADSAGQLSFATVGQLEPVVEVGVEANRLGAVPGSSSRTWQFFCPAGDCALRAGYVVRQPGRYVITVPAASVTTKTPVVSSCGGNLQLLIDADTDSWSDPAAPALPQLLPAGVNARQVEIDTFPWSTSFFFSAE